MLYCAVGLLCGGDIPGFEVLAQLGEFPDDIALFATSPSSAEVMMVVVWSLRVLTSRVRLDLGEVLLRCRKITRFQILA